MNVALIGYGRWGKIYAKTLGRLDDYRLKAVVSRSPERIRAQLTGVELCSSVNQLASIDIDALIIATPPHTHAEYIRAAVRLDKPCIVEKPVCLSASECSVLHDEVRRAGIAVLVDYLHLFSPSYVQMKRRIVESGERINLVVSEGVGLGPFRLETPTLWDWLPHDVALCQDLLGGRHLPSLQCISAPSTSQRNYEADMVYVRADYPQGATALMVSGCMHPERRRALSVFTDKRAFHLSSLPVNKSTETGFTYNDRSKYDSRWRPEYLNTKITDDGPPLDAMLAYFHEAVEGGDQGYMGLEFSIKVNEVIELIVSLAS